MASECPLFFPRGPPSAVLAMQAWKRDLSEVGLSYDGPVYMDQFSHIIKAASS